MSHCYDYCYHESLMSILWLCNTVHVIPQLTMLDESSL